ARELTTWAKFGPPLGHAWEPTDAEQRRFPHMAPLIGNDWTLPRPGAPLPERTGTAPAVDLARMTPVHGPEPDHDPSPAWRGTILPASDADTWLAAAFGDYDRIVALEHGLKAKEKDGRLGTADQERID